MWGQNVLCVYTMANYNFMTIFHTPEQIERSARLLSQLARFSTAFNILPFKI